MNHVNLARTAVTNARAMLAAGSTNRGPHQNNPRTNLLLNNSRGDLFADMPGGHNFQPRNLERLAAHALIHGAGNCEELTAVAWKHLKRQQVPMEWMYMPPHAGQQDHHFILINARNVDRLAHAGGQPALPPEIQANPRLAWGPTAVVCDPWYPYSGVIGTAPPFYSRPAVSVLQYSPGSLTV